MSVTTLEDPVSHRQTRFRYELVSEAFLRRVAEQLDVGEPVVLLGPRGIGKQFVLAQLQNHLNELRPGCAFVRLRCQEYLQNTPTSLVRCVVSELSSVLPNFGPLHNLSIECVSHEIRNHLQTNPCRIVFLVSNIDSLPDSFSRRLLKVFRELTSLGSQCLGRFTVVLTGASDLADLVHGENSEFAVRDQYVIQGFDLEVFSQHVEQLARAIGMTFGPRCSETLHREVGGNNLLFKVVINELIDARRVAARTPAESVTPRELRAIVISLKTNLSVFRDVTVRPFSRLESSVRSLEMLQQLLTANRCAVPCPTQADVPKSWLPAIDAPTELELCGVAKRDGNALTWASPMIQHFAQSYFNDWALGDGFACGNDWDRAVSCYHSAERKDRHWSFSAADRPRLSSVLRPFESEFFAIAGRVSGSVDDLRQFFTRMARHLLCLDDVSIWKFNVEKRKWELLRAEAASERQSSLLQTTQLTDQNTTIPTPLPATSRRLMPPPCDEIAEGMTPLYCNGVVFEVVVKLPKAEGFADECVFLSNRHIEQPISRKRLAEIEVVMRAFGLAYIQACKNQKLVLKSEYQQHLLGAIPDVLRVIGGSPNRTKQALERAGEVLRENGYRRVMFSMVDHAKQRIVGVIDCRVFGEVDIAKMTDWTLEVSYNEDETPKYEDIQQAVVLEARTIEVADAATGRLINQRVAQAADLKGMVVIPLKHGKEILGTMHVERQDRVLPEPDQVKALEFFARQVAKAIDATALVDMLDAALHEEPEAVILIDWKERIRFINQAAQRQFNLQYVGWQDRDLDIYASSLLPSEIVNVARRARESEKSVSRILDRENCDPPLVVVYTSPLKDWRDCVIGNLIQIRDPGRFDRILQSLEKFAACQDFESLGAEVLSVIKSFGHAWGRLYEFNEETDRLEGRQQFGFAEGSPGAIQFSQTILPSGGQAGSSRVCFSQAEPVIFSYCQSHEPGEEYTTSTGLTVLNIRDEFCPELLKKKEADCWIDFPLMAYDSRRQLGKISVATDELLTLEQFDFLRILMEAARSAFAAIAAKQDREAEAATEMRQAMLVAIGELCHHLQSKLSSLGTFTECYRYETTADEHEQLNRQWLRRLKALQNIVDEAKDYLRPLKCQRRSNCLLTFVREIVEGQLSRGAVQLIPSHGELFADFDDQLLRKAIEELIQNARKAVGESHPLTMSATVSALNRRGIPWCRIELRDNGPGIPQENLTRIFEDFFTEWSHPETKGTGLGLSYVQSVVSVHGGTITAVECKTGACFRIEFPRYERGLHQDLSTPASGRSA